MLGVGEPQPRDLEPEQLRRQIGVAARTLVGQRPQQGPLLIVVQDLHWAVPQPALTPEILLLPGAKLADWTGARESRCAGKTARSSGFWALPDEAPIDCGRPL